MNPDLIFFLLYFSISLFLLTKMSRSNTLPLLIVVASTSSPITSSVKAIYDGEDIEEFLLDNCIEMDQEVEKSAENIFRVSIRGKDPFDCSLADMMRTEKNILFEMNELCYPGWLLQESNNRNIVLAYASSDLEKLKRCPKHPTPTFIEEIEEIEDTAPNNKILVYDVKREPKLARTYGRRGHIGPFRRIRGGGRVPRSRPHSARHKKSRNKYKKDIPTYSTTQYHPDRQLKLAQTRPKEHRQRSLEELEEEDYVETESERSVGEAGDSEWEVDWDDLPPSFLDEHVPRAVPPVTPYFASHLKTREVSHTPFVVHEDLRNLGDKLDRIGNQILSLDGREACYLSLDEFHTIKQGIARYVRNLDTFAEVSILLDRIEAIINDPETILNMVPYVSGPNYIKRYQHPNPGEEPGITDKIFYIVGEVHGYEETCNVGTNIVQYYLDLFSKAPMYIDFFLEDVPNTARGEIYVPEHPSFIMQLRLQFSECLNYSANLKKKSRFDWPIECQLARMHWIDFRQAHVFDEINTRIPTIINQYDYEMQKIQRDAEDTAEALKQAAALKVAAHEALEVAIGTHDPHVEELKAMTTTATIREIAALEAAYQLLVDTDAKENTKSLQLVADHGIKIHMDNEGAEFVKFDELKILFLDNHLVEQQATKAARDSLPDTIRACLSNTVRETLVATKYLEYHDNEFVVYRDKLSWILFKLASVTVDYYTLTRIFKHHNVEDLHGNLKIATGTSRFVVVHAGVSHSDNYQKCLRKLGYMDVEDSLYMDDEEGKVLKRCVNVTGLSQPWFFRE
jgi:hypothetical protein